MVLTGEEPIPVIVYICASVPDNTLEYYGYTGLKDVIRSAANDAIGMKMSGHLFNYVIGLLWYEKGKLRLNLFGYTYNSYEDMPKVFTFFFDLKPNPMFLPMGSIHGDFLVILEAEQEYWLSCGSLTKYMGSRPKLPKRLYVAA